MTLRSAAATRPAPGLDVAVIGAGPAGAVAALAFALRGARVLLLEAAPAAANRLAGEWLHPPGVAVLSTIGLADLPATNYATGRGFVVFPHDASAPIRLAYPDGAAGFAMDHRTLVAALRETAAAHRLVRYVPGGRATAFERGVLTYIDDATGEQRRAVGRVVGADGKSSVARRWLGIPATAGQPVSSMAGIVLRGVELPHEGFGHVLLGGPGPVLMYRIGVDQVRACLDVPTPAPRGRAAARYLWNAYRGVFPAGLVSAFREAVAERPIAWAANSVRRRASYGQPELTLAGDAVGQLHPLTALGMTLALGDVECLSRAPTFSAYRHERAAQSMVAEWLAMALYDAFTRPDRASMALKQGIYQMWRDDARARDTTMRLLTGADTQALHFVQAFLEVMTLALNQLLPEGPAAAAWGQSAMGLVGLGRWGAWLAGTTLPQLAVRYALG